MQLRFRLANIERKIPEQLVEGLKQRREMQKGNLVLLLRARNETPSFEEQLTPFAIGRVVKSAAVLRIGEDSQDKNGTDHVSSPKSPPPEYYGQLSVSFDPISILNERGLLPIVAVAGSFFSYEPILTVLQETLDLPFREELLLLEPKATADPLPPEYDGIQEILHHIEDSMDATGTRLDEAQRAAFEHVTTHRLANIVGPPGTGKFFVGVELANAILDTTQQKVLIVCYTNHALDQFLEEIVKKVWSTRDIMRIGGRSKSEILQEYGIWTHTRGGEKALYKGRMGTN